jgi:hypothetical protein
MEDLGIELSLITKTTTDFSINNSVSIFHNIVKHNQHNIYLLSAELAYESLTIYLEGNMKCHSSLSI